MATRGGEATVTCHLPGSGSVRAVAMRSSRAARRRVQGRLPSATQPGLPAGSGPGSPTTHVPSYPQPPFTAALLFSFTFFV